MSESSQPGNNGPGQIISSVRSIRLAIFLITTLLIATCAVFNVLDFNSQSENILIYVDNRIDNTTNSTSEPYVTTMISPNPDLEISPIYLFLCGLSLSAISAFLRADFILKLIMMILTVIIQTVILYTSNQFQQYDGLESDSV